MRIIFYIIRKEFIQVFRNKSMLPIIFILPIVQLIILVNAATLEMKNIRLAIIDNDMSSTSQEIISKFKGSPFYIIKLYTFSAEEADKAMSKGNVDAIISIPSGFERGIIRKDKQKMQVVINAINGVTAGITNGYIQNIMMGYNAELVTKIAGKSVNITPNKTITITSSYWYNPQLNYKNFMVPAVLVILVTAIGMLLSGLNLVREKELGTIEQINVTPIKKYQFIAGKLIPFWILALVELAFGLGVGKLLFNIPIEGNLVFLFFIASIYLLLVLGIGLLISTMANTQQQAMFVLFFIMIIFIMMSGIFTAVESMPIWAQYLDRLNPIYYFMRALRMVLLKGSGMRDLIGEIVSLLIFAAAVLQIAVWRYKKTV